MTTLDARPDATTPASIAAHPVIWSSPETRLWVSLGGGEFAGMVELSDSHFVATDSVGGYLGSFGTLHEAQATVENPPERTHPSLLANFAVVAGAAAVVFAGAALGAIHI